MRKFIILALALILTGSVAYANFCARDYVPAATLLVPYGIVDLDDNYAPNYAGYTTLLTVTNVSAERILIHITVWSAWSYPVVDFDEVLSGYDVWSINFRDLLEGHFERFDTAVERVGGTITKTPDYEGFWGPQNRASIDYDSGLTPGPVPSAYGPSANDMVPVNLEPPQDIDFIWPAVRYDLNCYFPYGYLPSVGDAVLTTLVDDAAYLASLPHWDCDYNTLTKPEWLRNYDDTQAPFYVTVDVVAICTQTFPDDINYYYYEQPTEQNVLIGDIIYVDTANKFVESIPAVSIEADIDAYYRDSTDPDDPYFLWTFYMKYAVVNVATPPAVDLVNFDYREPLGQAFAFRYLNSGGITSAVRVWKNYHERYSYTVGTTTYRFMYGCLPYYYWAWDENENSKSRGGGPSGFLTKEPDALPMETQHVPLTNGNFYGLMPNNGWMLIAFNPAIPKTSVYYSWRPYQAWVGVIYYLGGFSTMLEAATIANVGCFPDQIWNRPNPIFGIDYDYQDYSGPWNKPWF